VLAELSPVPFLHTKRSIQKHTAAFSTFAQMFFAPVATAPGCPSAFNNACLQEIVPYCKPCQYIVENSVETVETPVPVESFQHSPKELVVFS
jgi:hypothetical protein